MFQNAGIVVDGYMGAHNPPGGFKSIDIAICTIEKANNLVNRLMEERRLNELGILFFSCWFLCMRFLINDSSNLFCIKLPGCY